MTADYPATAASWSSLGFVLGYLAAVLKVHLGRKKKIKEQREEKPRSETSD